MQSFMNKQAGGLTGFPSIDKPWLKYYKKCGETIIYPKETLFEFLWNRNKECRDRVVFQYFDKKISYHTFFESAERIAKALVKAGVHSGDMVTIMSMHTPETIYTFYGLNRIGAVANFVYPTLLNKELKQTLKDTNSKLLFVLDVFLNKRPDLIDDIDVPVILLRVDESMPITLRVGYRLKNRKTSAANAYDYRSFIESSKAVDLSMVSGNPDSVAAVVYTSGTTGEPKGVCLTNHNFISLALQDYNGLMEFVPGKTCLLAIPPFIGFGITQLHVLAGAGVISILHITLEPEAVVDKLFKYNPYVYLTGPAFINAFIGHKDGNLSNVKYFIGGGGAISDEQTKNIEAKLRRCGTKAVYSNGYGMTEASSLLCASANEISKKASVGIPFIDTNVKIVDADTGEPLKMGSIGELWFSTPTLMKEYLNKPDETQETIVTDQNGERWLKTGDLGTVDEDGFVFVTGRIKRIFITRADDGLACKLFPQHIEDIMQKSDYVKECGVIVREDDIKMNVAVAFVTLSDHIHTQSAANRLDIVNKLAEYAAKELPEYMVPASIHVIDKMPVTPSEKIDYKQLEKAYAQLINIEHKEGN